MNSVYYYYYYYCRVWVRRGGVSRFGGETGGKDSTGET